MVSSADKSRRIILPLVALFLCALHPAKGLSADEERPDYEDFDALVAGLYWRELYSDGGWTLYCGFRFGPDRRTPDGRAVGIDHIYPTEAMIRFLGCRNRMECRARKDGRFARMEADMHNLYPVWQTLVTFRSGRRFGELKGEDRRFEDCDIRWRNGILQPRAIARGNIARSIFYMHDTYGLPVDPAEWAILHRWNGEDPPSRQEKMRNDLVEKLQGRRNPYIDDWSVKVESKK